MKILAIESSCDETATAVVENGITILSSSVASSSALHAKYGGIVPEVAAREQLNCIIPTIMEALRPLSTSKDYLSIILNNIDAIAVTQGPGLIGSLLVGVETAKTIAFVTKKPIIPVNHVLAHMFANFIDSSFCHSREGGNLISNIQIPDQVGDDKQKIQFPAISLVVSGGHTELYLMESPKDIHWLGGTVDDAAGEAFDKTARLLGFENRGGVAIQEHAKQTELSSKLPRPLMHDGSLNFSFSGLKTAILREVTKLKQDNNFIHSAIQSLAYEVQEAICDVLVKKTMMAAVKHSARSILLSGGVSANLRLREKFNAHNTEYSIHSPPVYLCTDNAVYIASYAYFRGEPVDWHDITAIPDLSVEV